MDQAVTLRKMAGFHDRSAVSKRSGSSPLKVIAVTSGKGGVGKTNVVANMGIALSRMGQRVMVLDADLGLGNLDVILGLTPEYNMEHLFMGEKSLSEIAVRGPEGMLILPSPSGSGCLESLSIEQQLTLMTQMDQMETDLDIFLIDTGAGIASNVLYFCAAAEEIIILVSPEPTSITDSYALMKVLSRHHAETSFKLLVNMAKNGSEAREIYNRIAKAAERFLNVTVQYIGYIPMDSNLLVSVCNQRAIVDLFPDSKASREFARIARDIITWPDAKRHKGGVKFFWQKLITD